MDTDPSSHDLSFEVFNDSGDYLHQSTPIKNSRLSILFEPEISLDPEGEFETFDLDTSSGEFCSLFNTKLPGHRSNFDQSNFDQREQNAGPFLKRYNSVIGRLDSKVYNSARWLVSRFQG